MKKKRIGFVLLSNSRAPLASTRISVLNMLPLLAQANYEPEVLFEPPTCTETPDLSELPRLVARRKVDIVYFQKVRGDRVLDAVRAISACGVRTVYGVCDRVDNDMAAHTDLTIVVTEYLRSLYAAALHSRIVVVHDGIERPEVCKPTARRDRGSAVRPLCATLVTSHALHEIPVLGSPPSWLRVRIVGSYPLSGRRVHSIRALRWKLAAMRGLREKVNYLKFVSQPRIQLVNWTPDGVYRELLSADMGIIPVDRRLEAADAMDQVGAWKTKSENRLTMKMSVGLPVIATPIPSYISVIEDRETGYFADTRGDWWSCLEALRDPNLRSAVGQRARDAVLHRFSKEAQAEILIKALNSL